MWNPRDQVSAKELREAHERFEALLRKDRTREAEWQKLFADCPYILSRSLPLRVSHRQIVPLATPGKSESDFVILPDPTVYGADRGMIELKTPQSPVLTFPRKEKVLLSRAAATAVLQETIPYQDQRTILNWTAKPGPPSDHEPDSRPGSLHRLLIAPRMISASVLASHQSSPSASPSGASRALTRRRYPCSGQPTQAQKHEGSLGRIALIATGTPPAAPPASSILRSA